MKTTILEIQEVQTLMNILKKYNKNYIVKELLEAGNNSQVRINSFTRLPYVVSTAKGYKSVTLNVRTSSHTVTEDFHKKEVLDIFKKYFQLNEAGQMKSIDNIDWEGKNGPVFAEEFKADAYNDEGRISSELGALQNLVYNIEKYTKDQIDEVFTETDWSLVCDEMLWMLDELEALDLIVQEEVIDSGSNSLNVIYNKTYIRQKQEDELLIPMYINYKTLDLEIWSPFAEHIFTKVQELLSKLNDNQWKTAPEFKTAYTIMEMKTAKPKQRIAQIYKLREHISEIFGLKMNDFEITNDQKYASLRPDQADLLQVLDQGLNEIITEYQEFQHNLESEIDSLKLNALNLGKLDENDRKTVSELAKNIEIQKWIWDGKHRIYKAYPLNSVLTTSSNSKNAALFAYLASKNK